MKPLLPFALALTGLLAPTPGGFAQDVRPTVLSQFLNRQPTDLTAIDNSSILLDPNRLNHRTDSDVRDLFTGDGAGYANTLGFNTTTTTPAGATDAGRGPDIRSLFPVASRSKAAFDPAAEALRIAGSPLMAAQFMDMGQLAGGTHLDFFLLAGGAKDAATRSATMFSTATTPNPDGIRHMATFAGALGNSPYLILGLEDMYGRSDRDSNDLLFAVDVSAANLAALTATPEPATWLTLGACTALGLWWRRRLSPPVTAGVRS